MCEENKFGSYIHKKRMETEPYTSLRKMAEYLKISPVYMSNIENNHTPAPKDTVLERMSVMLKLDKSETEVLYDLAAKSKTYVAVPRDLPEYILQNEIVRIALRIAKDVNATDGEWKDFIDRLKARSRAEANGQYPTLGPGGVSAIICAMRW